jgi:hypothetical protein
MNGPFDDPSCDMSEASWEAKMSFDGVHEEMLVAVHGDGTPVRSRWTYRAGEPYAVTVAFQAGPGRWVEWVFARDIIDAGLVGSAGLGDVRIRPERTLEHSVVVLEISSPEGEARLELDLRSVAAFLDATAAIVPLGEEENYLDIDGLIDELTRV